MLRNLFLAAGVFIITATTLGLWDAWINHGSQPTYCLPFCLPYPLPNYIAGDTLVTVLFVGMFALVWVAVRSRGRR